MQSLAEKTITLRKGEQTVGTFPLHRLDTLIHQWEQGYLEGDPLEVFQKELALPEKPTEANLFQIKAAVKRELERWRKEVEAAVQGAGDVPVRNPEVAMDTPGNHWPPIMRVSVEQAKFLCQVGFFVAYILSGRNREWGDYVLVTAGCPESEIARARQRVEEEKTIAALQQGVRP